MRIIKRMRANGNDRAKKRGKSAGAAVFCAALVMMAMPMTAFAHTGPEADFIFLWWMTISRQAQSYIKT